MQTFQAICVGVIALELAVVLAAVVVVALHLKRTAEAIEVLAYRVDHEVENIGSTLRNGWMRSLGALASVATGIWSGRSRD